MDVEGIAIATGIVLLALTAAGMVGGLAYGVFIALTGRSWD